MSSFLFGNGWTDHKTERYYRHALNRGVSYTPFGGKQYVLHSGNYGLQPTTNQQVR